MCIRDRTGRYLKYALGEILLVVVGILIALSINNWNEKRKDRIVEKGLLDEILLSLEQEQELFISLRERLDRKDSAINNALNLRKYGQQRLQLSNKVIWPIFLGIRLSYNKGPYEALISAGLDKIQNQELRGLIIRYYQVSLPRNDGFIKEVIDFQKEVSDGLEKKLVEQGILKQEFIELDSGQWFYDQSMDLDLYRLEKSDVFLDILKNQSIVSRDYRSRLDNLIEDNISLIKLLEKNIID